MKSGSHGLDSTGDGRNMGTVLPFAKPGSARAMQANPSTTCDADATAAEDDGVVWGAWMARAQQGDRLCYQELLADIVPYLRAIARRFLGQDQDAEDVVQEILIVVHDIRHTYEPDRPFKPWLSTIATRRCIDMLRRRTRRLQHEIAEDGQLESHGSAEDSPDELIARGEEHHELHRALDRLPPRQREALLLLRIKELSLSEAAAQSEQSIGSLKVACHRALKGLQRALAGKETDHD